MQDKNIIDAVIELDKLRADKSYIAPFVIRDSYRLIDDGKFPEATIQVEANGRLIHEAATGNGPVDALARVLKKSLTPLFPDIINVKLIDYHAQVVETGHGISTEVEFTIIFTNGTSVWKVNPLSSNINNASFNVLTDGYLFSILKNK